MSKTSDCAKRRPREINLKQMGSKYTCNVFLVNENGVPGMRIDNLGPFSGYESLRLLRWIRDMFGEAMP